MPFKSMAEIIKWRYLVKEGKITQAQFDEAMAATPDPKALPEHVKPAKKKGKIRGKHRRRTA